VAKVGWGLGAVAVLTGVAVALVASGAVLLNHPSRSAYPVRGIDVSAYQGDIDWPAMVGQGIAFAFVKATEGSGFADPKFSANWAGADQAGLAVGAYHFFSFDSPGASQAAWFIAHVPRRAGALPPVADVELYGDYRQHPPGRAAVVTELRAFLDELEEAYGVAPIIYADASTLAHYLADDFADHRIWIRDVYSRPSLPDGLAWTFWQYADKGRLDGYAGPEKFVDFDVFAGTPDEFSALRTTG